MLSSFKEFKILEDWVYSKLTAYWSLRLSIPQKSLKKKLRTDRTQLKNKVKENKT